MKAMIMAAGIGTRLRPLTYSIPKPMIPIVNKPTLEHTLELLKRHHITEAMINLHTYPKMITNYFKDGSFYNMKINYSEEKELMGTAGGVKKVEDFFGETFLVMSGDGLTDIDIGKVIKFHQEKGALATMVLKKIEARFEYGVTIINTEGRIKKFIEKPKWGDVFADTVNTGIYIFQKEVFKFIPANKFYDFGHDLWPLLLEKGERIFGYQMEEYWCDIGNLHEYKKAQKDALEGKVKINIPGKKIKEKIWIGEGTKIGEGVKMTGPCLIGKRCQIESGVHMGAFTAIGNHSVILRNSVLKNCILWNNVYVDKNVELRNCIIGKSAHVSESISVFDGSIINIKE